METTTIKGYLFENQNVNSKAILKGYLIIDNKKVYVVCFLNQTKQGKKYIKIIERQKKK